MNQIGIHEIKQDPLGWLQRVEAGESLLIVRDNQPIAEVKPVIAESTGQSSSDNAVPLEEFDRILDQLTSPVIGGPPLPADFSRADIYADHD